MSADSKVMLSVIVPVHGVQGYLRQCLDSLLHDACPGLEIIAVNDRSPDGCGDILDEFARKDPRVRVRHLEENVGLGVARNIGLEMATGEYVWFVDSDDWVVDGATRAIYDRLVATRPDVLFFDYARAYWWGKVQRSVINHLFREPPASDVFTLAERPSVMQLMMTAWNKAIRRQFLLDLGLRFSSGYYEDLNVTYPILMAAERISLLDRMLYLYRQRRRGAITRTTGKKHFDAFAQYERIFDFMDRQGTSVDKFRAVMFDRMMWHLLIILGRGDRVFRDDRRKFFTRMSEMYRRYRPADHRPPGGQLGLKYRLIERDSYTLFTLFKWFNMSRIAVSRRAKKIRKRMRTVGGFLRGKARGLYYRMQRLLPVDGNLAVYSAYWNRGYSCNPRAIYEKARELAPSVRGVWIVRHSGQDTVPEGVEYVLEDSLAHFKVLARARYFINNVNYPDYVVKRKGTVHLMTQHGTPLKTMGVDQMRYPVGANDTDFKAMLTRSDRWDFLISSNPLSTEAWDRAFPCRYEMLEIGYPRNDRFAHVTEQEVERLRADLGIPAGKKAILYAPTHRDYQRTYEPMFDVGRLARRLGPGYVLLIRAHYYYKVKDLAVLQGWPEGSVIDVSGYPAVEDLCVASDMLLTDYSSIMFDYANLDRPIVIYANDWDTYQRTRGVYFDLLADPPGVVATTEDELAEAFTSGAAWGDVATTALKEFRNRFCPWDDGHAAERAVRRVFLGEPVSRPKA